MGKILISSDWHLDWYTAGVARFDDVASAVDETLEAAEKEEVDAYVFLGDLCDPPARSHRAVEYALTVIQRNGKRPSIWVTGNHDVIDDGQGTSTLQALKGYSSRASVIDRPQGGVWPVLNLWGIVLPYTPRSHTYDPGAFIRAQKAEYEKNGKGRPVLILGHLCIRGIHVGSETKDMPRGRDVFLPLDEIKECFPDACILCGHYHKQQTWEVEYDDGFIQKVHIPGSLERLTFGEEHNEPGYLIIEID